MDPGTAGGDLGTDALLIALEFSTVSISDRHTFERHNFLLLNIRNTSNAETGFVIKSMYCAAQRA